MRVVIQRVSEASVTIDRQVHGQIGIGLMVLVGIEDADTIEDIQWLSNKIINLRIFNDANGVMNCSVKDVNGDLLLVSQFTLHANTKKGNRPSWSRAAPPAVSRPLFECFVQQLERDLGRKVPTGVFGADMKVHLVNDGPVTIFIDSKDQE